MLRMKSTIKELDRMLLGIVSCLYAADKYGVHNALFHAKNTSHTLSLANKIIGFCNKSTPV